MLCLSPQLTPPSETWRDFCYAAAVNRRRLSKRRLETLYMSQSALDRERSRNDAGVYVQRLYLEYTLLFSTRDSVPLPWMRDKEGKILYNVSTYYTILRSTSTTYKYMTNLCAECYTLSNGQQPRPTSPSSHYDRLFCVSAY